MIKLKCSENRIYTVPNHYIGSKWRFFLWSDEAPWHLAVLDFPWFLWPQLHFVEEKEGILTANRLFQDVEIYYQSENVKFYIYATTCMCPIFLFEGSCLFDRRRHRQSIHFLLFYESLVYVIAFSQVMDGFKISFF
jgi:hypothetical protein